MTVAAPISDFRYLSTYIVKRATSAVDTSSLKKQTQTGWCPSASKPIDRSILLQDRECDLEYYQTYFSGKKKLCQDSRQDHAAHMEERQIIRCYKFGIYQLLPGQTLEQEGLANPCDSCTPAFMDFVHWLGEPVQLRNWKGYRAGLDVIGDTTGDKSIFTNWNGYQIMFHCAPFMPFDPNDQQQVERRRFIGNDIVVIIFKESDDEDDMPFDLCSVGSRQNHIICIVRPISNNYSSTTQSYRVSIAVKDGIRNFSPVDFPAVLQRDDASRDLLLLKRMLRFVDRCHQLIDINVNRHS
ncbi:GTPase-activating Rap/Ran-GAP domain-like protein 3 [Mortierella sp. AD094]|nr:GTPase-activating Rap/Ran-GAP domain-like protein 3 [Mortierella sp. AD094]